MRPRSDIETAVRRRIGSGGSPGMVVGLWHAGAAEIVAAGMADPRAGTPVEAGTTFEFGSITKALTGVLLALMAEAGDVALDETAGEVLAGRLGASRFAERTTLLALATHDSGLPGMPPELDAVDLDAPHPDYPLDALYRFLERVAVVPDAGYSNLGYAVLGHCLSVRAGQPFARLLRERVLAPLGMDATGFDLPRTGAAAGHGPEGEPRPAWVLPETMQGAGGLRGPVGDLLRLVAASLRPSDTPVGRALREAQRARCPWSDDAGMGMGWVTIHDFAPDRFVQKGGLTAGFSANMVLAPARGEGVVVLSNAFQCVADLSYFPFDRRFGLYPEPRWEPAFLAPEV